MTRVLVVDDQEENRYLLSVLLRGHGFEVEEAGHGAEALARARQAPPDLLITDLLMPVMDGYTLLRRWKADERLRAAPVVVYTATYTEPQDERLALDLGADAFVVKPAEPEDFVARLERLLSRARAGDLSPARPPALDEPEQLADYSRALVRKLEDKRFELERLNAELRASEERFRRLAENAPDLIYRYELVPERRFAYVSPAATELTGYTPEEHYADPDLGVRIVHPEDRPQLERYAAQEGALAEPLVLRWIRKDGSILWTEQRNVPIRDEQGRLVALEGIARDVTERRRAEEALRESRELLRRAVLDAPFPMLVHAEDGEVVQVNKSWLELTGYRASELPTIAAWTELAYGERRERVRADIDSLYSLDRRIDEGEYLVRTRDGSARTWHFSSAPLGRLPDGRRLVISMAMDVTASKIAERQLRDSEERYRLLFEANPQPMWVYDLETLRFLAVNAAAVRHYGFSRDEFLGMTIADIRPPEEVPRLLDNVRAVTEGLDEAGVWRHRRRDGSLIEVEITSHTLDLEGRRAELVLALDVTARRRAQAELRSSEERFRELAETIEDVFWITDAEKERMLYVSPAYERVWGRSCASLYENPRSWLAALHPEDRARVKRAALARQVSGDYEEEYRVVRPDGGVRWIRDRGYPVADAAGRVARIVGVARDITQRRELAEQLRQSQKLEAVGRLAGGVAHDFNNLLAVILMQTELLAGPSATREALADGLAQIRAAAERGAGLTRQLLLFGRRQPLQRRNLDLDRAVAELSAMLRRLLGEDVELELRLNAGERVTLADAGMIDQVLMNLAVNARDAMPRGGRLRIETGVRLLSERESVPRDDVRPGPYLRLRVEDSGSGIAPEALPHLFEPFFTTKPRGQGTGLGLATVFGIVREHGGWIEVDSEPGRGARFDVFLPAVAGAASEARRAEAGDAPGGHETLLLVEDEVELRRLGRRVLERHGYEVLEAGSGEEALARFREARGRVRLLVTDLVLPGGLDGRELAMRLAAEDAELRVLWTSGFSADHVEGALPTGRGRAFLQKPATARELLEAVRRCLDG